MFISWIFRQHLFCTFCLEIGTAIILQIITKLYAVPRIIDLTFQKDLFTRTKVIAQLQLNNEYRYRVKSVSNEQLQKLIFVLRHDKIIKISNSFFFQNTQALSLFRVLSIFASQGLRFGSPFSPSLADLEYILKFARNATWWFIEVAPLRQSSSSANQNRFVIRMLES